MLNCKAQWELCRNILGIALFFFGAGVVWADETPVGAKPVTPELSPIEKTLGIKKTVIPDHQEYKVDADYKKILRYDFLPYWLERERKAKKMPDGLGDPTVRRQDKAMILAGKGFQIPDLQRFEPDPGVEINEYNHIDFDAPPPPLKEKKDRLDPEFKGAVYRKDLIFHPNISAFHNVEPRVLKEDVLPEVQKPLNPPREKNSRLLLWSSRKTKMILAPGKKQWDLLHDDEYRNRLDYTRTQRTARLTEKKGSSPSSKPARTR